MPPLGVHRTLRPQPRRHDSVHPADQVRRLRVAASAIGGAFAAPANDGGGARPMTDKYILLVVLVAVIALAVADVVLKVDIRHPTHTWRF